MLLQQRNLASDWKFNANHVPDGTVFNDLERILQARLPPPRGDGAVLAVEESLRFEGRDSRRFHLTSAKADAFRALGLVHHCWDAKSMYWPATSLCGRGSKASPAPPPICATPPARGASLNASIWPRRVDVSCGTRVRSSLGLCAWLKSACR
jgi:hypothetical protein